MDALLDEATRQRALDTYRIVDTLPEAAYDDIVRLAALLCDAPIAMVSLVDRDRQWFKARVGTELRETSRDIAFCDHVIRDPGVLMEVNDAQKDPRFADNPLVTGDTNVRFYAGMPLVTPGGAAIGTVCVLDHQARELTPKQREALGSLARLTMNLLEGRHRERDLERAALLAKAAAAEAAPAAQPAAEIPPGFAVAIFELQDLATAVIQRGERAVERAMAQLEKTLDSQLRHGRGDSVSRVSGSAEVIAVLHGADTDEVLKALRQSVPAFEKETGLHVLSSTAQAAPPDEALAFVYLRADEALTELKDELMRRNQQAA